MTDPVTHSTTTRGAVTTMSHHVLLIDPQDKKAVTSEVANRQGRRSSSPARSSAPTGSPVSCGSVASSPPPPRWSVAGCPATGCSAPSVRVGSGARRHRCRRPRHPRRRCRSRPPGRPAARPQGTISTARVARPAPGSPVPSSPRAAPPEADDGASPRAGRCRYRPVRVKPGRRQRARDRWFGSVGPADPEEQFRPLIEAAPRWSSGRRTPGGSRGEHHRRGDRRGPRPGGRPSGRRAQWEGER